jgi:thioredoxin 1
VTSSGEGLKPTERLASGMTDADADHGRPLRVTGVDELDDLVASESPVLAEFYTRSCPKCDAQEPILGGVASEFEGVVAMVDPGEDMSLLAEYGVRSTPGFVRFVEGEPTGTLADGVVGAERLLAFARGETAD